MGRTDANAGCPICGGHGRLVFRVDGFPILECGSCEHRFAGLRVAADHVSVTYSDEYFFGGGAGYANYLSEQSILTDHGRRYAELVSRHSQPRSMLDVGSSAGFLMDGFREKRWRCTGLEPNARMAEYAQRNGHEVHVETLEQFRTTERFDLVCMVQVIAHMHDLRLALENAARHTAIEGLWLVETWNYRSLTARFLGRHWHEYSPPSVLHWFSPRSLTALAGRYGMVPIAQGRPKKLLNAAHAKSLLRHRLGSTLAGRLFLSGLGWIPDRLDLRYPAEDLFWMLLRKRDQVNRSLEAVHHSGGQ